MAELTPALPSSAPLLEVDGLTVRFGGATSVDSVSFSVAPGECFGIVGESGSGKSTMLRAISGLHPHWTGRIAVAGLDPRRRDRALPKTVQMVFQDPYGSLHPRQTIDRCLSEPLEIHRIGDAEARIVAALEEVGLDARFRFRYPHQLSGGQRQRVAIARALILQPRLLLLDEPTSALDVSVQAEVLNLLARLRAEHGLTYVLVSHNLPVVAHMCARSIVMRGGRIVEELTREQIATGRAETDYAASLIAASRNARPGARRAHEAADRA